VNNISAFAVRKKNENYRLQIEILLDGDFLAWFLDDDLGRASRKAQGHAGQSCPIGHWKLHKNMSDLRRSGKKDELISRNVSLKLTILLIFYLDVLTASIICLALTLVTLPSGRAADKQERTFGNQNYTFAIYTAIKSQFYGRLWL
jgi:hypothetical protein